MGEEDTVLNGFADLPLEPPKKREVCDQCTRPRVVCWCPFLPKEPVCPKSTLVILQHPGEERRCLRTAPMLVHGLSRDKCLVYRGKKFPNSRHELLEELLSSSDTLILYPGKDAVNLKDIPTVQERDRPYNLVILDGTWAQAKSMYYNSPILHNLQLVKLTNKGGSNYIIRTQPSENCLSTVESAAISLSVVEEQPEIRELLLKPLHALCHFQLTYGAVEHQSKDFLLVKGRYPHQVGKRTARFFK